MEEASTRLYIILTSSITGFLRNASAFVVWHKQSPPDTDLLLLLGYKEDSTDATQWSEEYSRDSCFRLKQEHLTEVDRTAPPQYKRDYLFPFISIQSISSSLLKNAVKPLGKLIHTFF